MCDRKSPLWKFRTFALDHTLGGLSVTLTDLSTVRYFRRNGYSPSSRPFGAIQRMCRFVEGPIIGRPYAFVKEESMPFANEPMLLPIAA